MPTIGQQFVEINTLCLKLYDEAQNTIDSNEPVFEKAYKSLVIRNELEKFDELHANLKFKRLDDQGRKNYEQLKNYLQKPEVKSQKGRIEHLFKLAFAGLGNDTVTREIKQLDDAQKAHLIDQYHELKNDLLAITQRILLMTLKSRNYQWPAKTADMSDETYDFLIYNYLENLKLNDEFAKKVQEQLQNIWIQVATEVDKQINWLTSQNLQHVSLVSVQDPQQVNIVVVQNPPVVVVQQPQKVNLVTNQITAGDVFDSLFLTRTSHYHSCYRYNAYHYHHDHYNPWHSGWHDAHHHHHDMWLYRGHREDPIGFEMIRCFEKICCDSLQLEKFTGLCPCNSCGKFNCTDCSSIMSCNICNSVKCCCEKLSDCKLPEFPKINFCGTCENITCSCGEKLSNLCTSCQRVDCSCGISNPFSSCGCSSINCSGRWRSLRLPD